MDDNFTIKGNYHSNAGFLIHNSSWAEAIEYDDVTSCGHKKSGFIHHTFKEGRNSTIQKEKNNLITIYGKRRNVARFLPKVVESHANTENQEWKDEKEELLRDSKREGEETKLKADDGVEEIKVTNNVSYVTTSNDPLTTHKGNWIVRCPTIAEKRIWWNLGLFSPTISEISSIPSSLPQERDNNNSVFIENEEVSEKRVGRITKYSDHYRQKKQEKKQFLQRRQGIRRNSANRLKQFANNYKLDGLRDEDRLEYICDINDKQKVNNATSAAVGAAATTFVAADSYYDDCVRNQQPLIETNINNNKLIHDFQKQKQPQNHDVRSAKIRLNEENRQKGGCVSDSEKIDIGSSASSKKTSTSQSCLIINNNTESGRINNKENNQATNHRKNVGTWKIKSFEFLYYCLFMIIIFCPN